MNICLACFEDRLAAVFENASELKVFAEGSDGKHLTLSAVGVISLEGRDVFAEVAAIQQQGATMLICGAMCGRTRFALEKSGLKIMPWIKGEVAQVIKAYCADELESQVMPGCHNKRLAQGKCPNRMGQSLEPKLVSTHLTTDYQTNPTKG